MYIKFPISLNPVIIQNNSFKTKYTTFKYFNNLFKSKISNLINSLEGINPHDELDNWIQEFHNIINIIGKNSLKIKSFKNYPKFT